MTIDFQGQQVIMDDEDYPYFKRCLEANALKIVHNSLYVGAQPFHRLIMGDPHLGRIRQNISFRNHNHLDVRKNNLIIGTKKDRWKRILDTVSKYND